MDPSTLFILFRSLERLVIVLIAGASLWMGWQLFLRMQLEQQQAEVSWKDVSVKLQRVGPGIFFAAFGTVVLGIFAWNLPTFTPTGQTTFRLLGNDQDSQTVEARIVGLNIAINIAESPVDQTITKGLRESLHQRRVDLTTLRNDLLRQRFGEQKVATWLRWRDELRAGGRSVPADSVDITREIETTAMKLKTGD